MVQQYFDESHNMLRQTIRKFLERDELLSEVMKEVIGRTMGL